MAVLDHTRTAMHVNNVINCTHTVQRNRGTNHAIAAAKTVPTACTCQMCSTASAAGALLRWASYRRRHNAEDAQALHPHVCRLPTAWDAAAQRKIPIVGVGAPHLHVSGARVGATHLSKCDARRELDLNAPLTCPNVTRDENST